MTIYVDKTQSVVNQLKGGVITIIIIIRGTLVKALHCGEVKCM